MKTSESLESRLLLTAPVAADWDIGTLAAGTTLTVDAADIVDEFGTDADGDLTATSITFGTATVDGVPAGSLTDVGFAYSPGAGTAGAFSIDTLAAAFAGLSDTQDAEVVIDFTISDGTDSDMGEFSYQVNGESLGVVDFELFFLGDTVANQDVVAEADDVAGGVFVDITIAIAGPADISGILTGGDIDLNVNLDGATGPALDDAALTIAIASATDGSTATATAANGGKALAFGNFDSVAMASANESRADAVANTDGTATAVANNNSAALATASDLSDAQALAENQSAAEANAALESSATATADNSSVATADADSSSTALAISDDVGSATAVAEDDSVSNADAAMESIATSVATDGSASTADATGTSDAQAIGTMNSAAEATAENESRATATAELESGATATASGSSVAEATSDENAASTAFAEESSTGTAEATDGSTANGVATDGSLGVALASDGSDALAFAENNATAEATATTESSSSTTADSGAHAIAFGENGATVTATSAGNPEPSALLVAGLSDDGVNLAAEVNGQLAGAPGIPLPLPIDVDESDGQTLDSIVISGFPAGSVLTAGTPNSDGSEWTFTSTPPADLEFTTPHDFVGEFDLVITGAIGDDFASASRQVTIGGSCSTVMPGDGVTLVGDTLFVAGSDGADRIRVTETRKGQVKVRLNKNKATFDLDEVATLVVCGFDGTDKISRSARSATPAILDGGDGNDRITGSNADETLVGGAGSDRINAKGGDDFIDAGAGRDRINAGYGNDIVLAGDGNDIVNGSKGRDILFGDDGEDLLRGGSGEDILIGGSTELDLDALQSVLAEWTSERAYEERIANISNDSSSGVNGDNFLTTATVTDSDAGDTLAGGCHTDWFFANSNDILKGRKDFEELTII